MAPELHIGSLKREENRMPQMIPEYVANPAVCEFFAAAYCLCKPDHVHWCDGSEQEYDALCAGMLRNGTLRKLNPEKHPKSYLVCSDPGDLAQTEDRSYVCSARKEDAGSTNNRVDPWEMKTRLRRFFDGSMRGRTMYVIPFCMGPIGSPFARFGIQLTDSPYVAASMWTLARKGLKAWQTVDGQDFDSCLHSVGMPLGPGEKDVPWPCNNATKFIAHFPEERSIWSYGGGYGSNAFLGKKCITGVKAELAG